MRAHLRKFAVAGKSTPAAPGGFGFSCPVGMPYVNVQTARTTVRAFASMNAVSRERSTPAAAADVVTLTYLRATPADSHPTYS